MRLGRLLLALAFAGLLAGSPTSAAPRAGGRPGARPRPSPGGGGGAGRPAAARPKYAPNTVLVRLKSGPAAAAAAAKAPGPSLPGLTLVSMPGEDQRASVPQGAGPAAAAAAAAVRPPRNAVMKFRITDGSSVRAKLKQLNALPGVDLAQPEYIYYRTATVTTSKEPNDPMYGPGSYSSGQWYLPHVWAPTAWATTVGSSSIRVCMIDSGARRSHQDLRSNIVTGWNRAVYGEFTGSPTQPALGSTLYNNFDDVNGHGTHTTGTVGGVGDNGVGITGINWKVSLHICKAASDASGGLFESALLDCYYLCRRARAHVVSNSYGGGPYSQFSYDAIAKLRDAGILFVAAAGNEYSSNDDLPFFPASYKLDNVISVAATNADDTLSPFSNWGINTTHLAAPGTMILNTWIGSDSAYETISGTSMATPLVAGAAALLWSARSTATYAQIKAALMAGVDKVPALTNRVISGGRLNVARSLAKLLGRPDPTPPPEPASHWVTDDGVAYQGTYRQFVLTTVQDPYDCLLRCQNTPWCTAVVAYTDEISIAGNALGVTQDGNCAMYDKSFLLTDRVSDGTAVYSAYKQTGSPAPMDLPPLQAMLGSWGSPIPITTLPYTSSQFGLFVEDRSPVACSRERSRVRVFRWFSGGAAAGYATASTCSSGTTGDTSVSVLSSPNQGGPYSCMWGQDDASAGACPSNPKSFVYSFAIQPNTHYFIAVSPFNVNAAPAARFRLSFNAFPGQPLPQPPPPSTGPGSWANPLPIPDGVPGLSFLSGTITDWSVKTPQPIECTALASPTAVVFRWFSGDVQSGLLTAGSCGTTVGDPVVVVLKSSSPDANANTLTCLGANDDDTACPTNSNTVGAFAYSLYVEPQTHYWFAAAPYDAQTTTSIQLRLSLSCQPPAGTWDAPAPVPSIPFTSQRFCGFNRGAPPVPCAMGRNSSVVFRWFSGAESGFVTASSCQVTTGDPVISILSSTNPDGPFTCVGGNDDDFGCSSNNARAGAFGLRFAFRASTYYWFAVAPSSETAVSNLQLKLTKTVTPPPAR